MRYSPWEDIGRRQVAVSYWELPEDEDARWVPDIATVVMDPRLTQTERRCALAHEIVHLEREHVAGCDGKYGRMQESEADLIAAKRLIPLSELARALMTGQDEHDLADALWVTPRIVRVRLDNLTEREKTIVEARIGFAEQLEDLRWRDLDERVGAGDVVDPEQARLELGQDVVPTGRLFAVRQ